MYNYVCVRVCVYACVMMCYNNIIQSVHNPGHHGISFTIQVR